MQTFTLDYSVQQHFSYIMFSNNLQKNKQQFHRIAILKIVRIPIYFYYLWFLKAKQQMYFKLVIQSCQYCYLSKWYAFNQDCAFYSILSTCAQHTQEPCRAPLVWTRVLVDIWEGDRALTVPLKKLFCVGGKFRHTEDKILVCTDTQLRSPQIQNYSLYLTSAVVIQ